MTPSSRNRSLFSSADAEPDEARFLTTRWTMVLKAAGEGAERQVAMEEFAKAYWYPVYAFIRRKGQVHEAAEDLTQSFFAEMLEKNWLAGVERRETRFSTLLLTILTRYLIDEHRHATRQKRGSGQALLSINMGEADRWYGAEPHTEETPERIFERRFAFSVLSSALATMQEALHNAGRGKQFATLSPFLSREPAAGEFDVAAAVMGVSNNAVASAVLRMRREYRTFVRAEVAAGLTDPSRVEEELRHLAAALGG